MIFIVSAGFLPGLTCFGPLRSNIWFNIYLPFLLQINSFIINYNIEIDELSINVSYDKAIESISYQWYRGIATPEEINEYEETRKEKNSSQQSDEDDDELQEESDEIVALGEEQVLKLSNENGKEIKKIVLFLLFLLDMKL